MRSMKCVSVLCLLLPVMCYGQAVHKWGLFETSIESRRQYDGNQQCVDIQFELTDPRGKQHMHPGFWDGGKTWRVRFSPSVIGGWKWRSRCEDDASLDDKSGTFECVPYHGKNPFYNHGPVKVSDNGHYLMHTDGVPFFWLVDTAWNGALKSTEEDWDRFLDDRVAKSFTGIQYVVTQWRTAYANAEGLKA